ncbi:hypothetical protein ILUMI_02982 [Ignelater luminosus]|uniref:DDE-1 domain-containing protein n=1 Tax=Ignelater luminosus TaxID=2038154 RepID=A0A8K0DHD0_IGNLU|nr:hypothetical protein ILUMI_02982 [Ignelater luminosus]
MPKEVVKSVPQGWGVGHSDSGWMKKEIFYEYVANVFYPSIVNAKVDFPVLLFVDGHKTHLDIKLSDLCSNLQIILGALYPNATRILQPADVSAFKPLKTGWKKRLAEWRRENPEKDVTKETFAPILQCVLEKSINPKIIANGFRACGLNPWNPDAIHYSKCLAKNPSNKIKQENTVINDL